MDQKTYEQAALRRTADVVEIDPALIVDDEGRPIDLKNTGALAQWLLSKYRNMKVEIADDGEIVELNRDGLRAGLKKRGREQKQAYAELDALLENALYDTFQPPQGRRPGLALGISGTLRRQRQVQGRRRGQPRALPANIVAPGQPEQPERGRAI
ncbi:MAG: hypothetical protein LBS31_06860 [Candidatus Adiutrix sp.]|nr:hypothetical protein [Candidatus Adiutrix sp.]